MNTSLPPLHPLPSGWADLAALPAAPTPALDDAGVLAWFGAAASGRVLAADPHAGNGRDVQAWADAVLHHLVDGAP